MATMNISLPDSMRTWVEGQVKDGRYGNSSDYIRDLIRKDQERRQAVTLLQDAITEGLESGPGEILDGTAFKRRMRERHGVR